MSIHPDRVRLAALMDRLRIPPPGPDPDVEAEVIEALELWGRVLERDERGEDLIPPDVFRAMAEDLLALVYTARAAGGRPLPPVPIH